MIMPPRLSEKTGPVFLFCPLARDCRLSLVGWSARESMLTVRDALAGTASCLSVFFFPFLILHCPLDYEME